MLRLEFFRGAGILLFFFFFFQAEDGIRDLLVTGVQTCALPISRGCSRAAAPVCGFSRGTTATSVRLSWGGKEVGSPCEWRGGARLYSQVIVGESGLETCCRRTLEVFLGLRQDTLGSLDLCR